MATRARRPPTAPLAADTLFGAATKKSIERGAPLAERIRPHTLADLVGQKHLFFPGSLLTQAIAGDRVRSMVLWGPPGSGKTTLARVIAAATRSHFVPFSAVLGSVGELREIVAVARDRLAFHGQRTIVFVDEIHRFNKAQQDAFLPHVEDGTIVLVGATTENPSFAVNAALLSRCKVFRLEALAPDDILVLLQRALHDSEHGLGAKGLSADEDAIRAIAQMARGDARRALSTLELVADYLDATGGKHIDAEVVAAAESHRPLLYDKAGEEHYNVVSAFIKSMRGSDPDAAIYWMMRMLEAGDDPLFVSRRMLIFASEDVGNADSAGTPRRPCSGRDTPARRDAGGHLSAFTRVPLLGECAEVERMQRGMEAREGARRTPRRTGGAEEATERRYAPDERGGLRRGIQVRARFRGGRRCWGDLLAGRAGGHAAVRADRPRRGDPHSRTTRGAEGTAREMAE